MEELYRCCGQQLAFFGLDRIIIESIIMYAFFFFFNYTVKDVMLSYPVEKSYIGIVSVISYYHVAEPLQ